MNCRHWIAAAGLLAFFVAGCGGAQLPLQAPNTDVNELRAILHAESAKAGTQAVVFGMRVGNTEIFIEAVGDSNPGVRATTGRVTPLAPRSDA